MPPPPPGLVPSGTQRDKVRVGRLAPSRFGRHQAGELAVPGSEQQLWAGSQPQAARPFSKDP